MNEIKCETTACLKNDGADLIKVGTIVETVGGAAQGDWDENEDGSKNETTPGEKGSITDVYLQAAPPYCTVWFPASECCVNPEVAELIDPQQYKLYPGPQS